MPEVTCERLPINGPSNLKSTGRSWAEDQILWATKTALVSRDGTRTYRHGDAGVLGNLRSARCAIPVLSPLFPQTVVQGQADAIERSNR